MILRTWSPDVRDLGDLLAALTVDGAAELADYLEQAHGVRPETIPLVRPDHLKKESEEQETPAVPAERDVVLQGYPAARRIAVIRAVRELTGLGLKEALALVNGVPAVVRGRLPVSEAERVKAALEAAGAEVVLR